VKGCIANPFQQLVGSSAECASNAQTLPNSAERMLQACYITQMAS